MTKRAQRGSTMIEVMMAILIFSIGLLGIASTQTLGLTNTQSALNRNYATQLAYEVMDIVRLNPEVANGIAANATQTYVTIDGDDDRQLNEAPLVANADCIDATEGCDSDEFAETELDAWSNKLARTLPDGQGRLVWNPVNGLMTLTLTWVDVKSLVESDAREDVYDNDESRDQITNIAGDVRPDVFTYTVSFVP